MATWKIKKTCLSSMQTLLPFVFPSGWRGFNGNQSFYYPPPHECMLDKRNCKHHLQCWRQFHIFLPVICKFFNVRTQAILISIYCGFLWLFSKNCCHFLITSCEFNIIWNLFLYKIRFYSFSSFFLLVVISSKVTLTHWAFICTKSN